MGCLSSSNHRKKYLDESPQDQKENSSPQRQELPIVKRSNSMKQNEFATKKSAKPQLVRKPGTIQTKSSSRQKSSDDNVTFKKQSFKNFNNHSTQPSKNQLLSQHKTIQNQKTLTLKQQQRKMNEQQQKILEIIKRSKKINKVYRNICEKMNKYNQEEFNIQCEE